MTFGTNRSNPQTSLHNPRINMTAGTRLWARLALSLFCFGGIVLGFVAGQTADDTKKKSTPAPMELVLPDVFKKPTPANVEELRAIEQHVQKVVEKVMPAVVNLKVGPGQGSGVIINEKGLILTAGHVSGTPNKDATVVFSNGKSLKGKTLGQNTGIDSGMVKIVVEGTYPFLEMGKSSELKVGQWVLAIGHPGGFRANRPPVVRLGRILFVDNLRGIIQTDCALVGGDSGGPLFDMQGRVIGIHSRIGGSAMTENIHVPIDTYRQTFARLEKGDTWRGSGAFGGPEETVRSAGGKNVFKKDDALTNDDPTMLAPKDKAESTPSTDARKSFYKTYTFRMKAGSTYTIDMIASAGKFRKKKNNDEVFDPFLRLESPAGKELAENDDITPGINLNSRIVYKALKDGDYRIIATTFEGEQTGKFTVNILEAEFKDAIVSGQVDLLRAVIKLPAPQAALLLEKLSHAKDSPHINALILDNNGDPLANKEITINWEKGAQKLKSDNQGLVRWPLNTDKSRKLNLLLPAGIRAMVALTDKDGNALIRDDPSVEKVKSAGGMIVQTFDGSLKKTDPFDFEREKCVRHIHEFKVQPGKVYTFDLLSEDFDAYLRLEDADGNKIAEDDNGAGFRNSRIVYSAAADGTVRIVATTCNAGETGGYRIVIRETSAKTTEPKAETQP
jgi:serine protease Do